MALSRVASWYTHPHPGWYTRQQTSDEAVHIASCMGGMQGAQECSNIAAHHLIGY